MKKKNKQPKELMIKSVMKDLEKEMAEVSIHRAPKDDKDATALADAILNPVGMTSISNSKIEATGTVEVPAGLQLSKKDQKNLIKSSSSSSEDEKTQLVGSEKPIPPVADLAQQKEHHHDDRTHVVGQSPAQPAKRPEQKVSFGAHSRSSGYEAQFMQAENLKLAQQRIVELEKDIEKLRKENEILASAGELSQQKIEDYLARIHNLERQKNDLKDTSVSELQIFRDGLGTKESEIARLRSKVEELESRLSNDLRKIRVRERELENRLELSKMEKMALLKTKDETILDLKRKNDSLEAELENYQNRILELNRKLESNQDQFGRTVRALRIALTNLEVNENTGLTIAPLKKAE